MLLTVTNTAIIAVVNLVEMRIVVPPQLARNVVDVQSRCRKWLSGSEFS